MLVITLLITLMISSQLQPQFPPQSQTIGPIASEIVYYGSTHRQQFCKIFYPAKPLALPIPLVGYATSGGWQGAVKIPETDIGALQAYLDAGFAVAYMAYAWTGMPGQVSGIFPQPEEDVRQFTKFFRSGAKPYVGANFVAMDGRSAGAQGVLYACIMPNPAVGITRPDVGLVGALAAHNMSSLIQNFSSGIAPHLGGGWQLKTLTAATKTAASPRHWLYSNAATNTQLRLHVTIPATTPTAAADQVPTNLINHHHDAWNATALVYDVNQVSSVPAKVVDLGASNMSIEDSFVVKAQWLRAYYRNGTW